MEHRESMGTENTLRATLRRDGIELDEHAIERLVQFVDLLSAWNSIHNLTGAKSPEEIVAQIVDSIYPITFLLHRPASLLDIGTGAGFPGLVLAAVWPRTDSILCEPLRKRAAFLRYAAMEMGLERVTVDTRRIQELTPRPFELITSRAVTETSRLLEWCRPFVDEKTHLLFYKGEQVTHETQTISHCSYTIVRRGQRRYLWIKEPNRC